jgi:hypothetical protein
MRATQCEAELARKREAGASALVAAFGQGNAGQHTTLQQRQERAGAPTAESALRSLHGDQTPPPASAAASS